MEIELIKWIQSFSTPFLDAFFQGITLLGEETLYLLVLTFIYWTVSKQAGTYIGFALFTSFLVNNGLKDTFQFTRPIGIDGIRSLYVETATGYSFPSGHTQGATTFFTALMLLFQKKWFTFCGSILIFLVALSRLYLGVHYPKDVIVGVFVGVMIAYGIFFFFQQYPFSHFAFFFLLSFTVGLLFFHSEDYVKAYGLFTGFVFGALFEQRYVQFSPKGSLVKKLFRWGVGVVLILFIKLSGNILFPHTSIFDGFRYFLIGCFVIGIYPLLFTKLKM